jgi:hypothetical protein
MIDKKERAIYKERGIRRVWKRRNVLKESFRKIEGWIEFNFNYSEKDDKNHSNRITINKLSDKSPKKTVRPLLKDQRRRTKERRKKDKYWNVSKERPGGEKHKKSHSYKRPKHIRTQSCFVGLVGKVEKNTTALLEKYAGLALNLRCSNIA